MATSLMDYEPEEIERKATISSSLACFEWNKHKINLIDTPGDDNFIYDAKLCMRVLDGAVVVVGAVSGVGVQTERVWGYADEFGVPLSVFINKMDRERADFEKTVEDIRKTFADKTMVVVQLPIGKEEGFKGVIDLISMKAYVYKDDQSGAFDRTEIPADLAAEASKYREKLIETAVEMDDAVDGALPQWRRDQGRRDRAVSEGGDLEEKARSGNVRFRLQEYRCSAAARQYR